MSIISNFLFFEDTEDVSTSNNFVIPTGSTLIIEVAGTFTGLALNIEGRVDIAIEQWNTLPITNINTLQSINSITEAGLYRIDITGLSTVRADITGITTGSVKVFGKLVLE